MLRLLQVFGAGIRMFRMCRTQPSTPGSDLFFDGRSGTGMSVETFKENQVDLYNGATWIQLETLQSPRRRCLEQLFFSGRIES